MALVKGSDWRAIADAMVMQDALMNELPFVTAAAVSSKDIPGVGGTITAAPIQSNIVPSVAPNRTSPEGLDRRITDLEVKSWEHQNTLNRMVSLEGAITEFRVQFEKGFNEVIPGLVFKLGELESENAKLIDRVRDLEELLDVLNGEPKSPFA